MADEELTHGEIGRRLDRIERQQQDTQRAMDDRITQVAGQMVPSTLFATTVKGLQEDIGEVKADMHAGFDRAEKTAIERRDAQADQIRDLKKKVDGAEGKRTAKAANWIAFALLMLTAIGLLVTILGHGGH